MPKALFRFVSVLTSLLLFSVAAYAVTPGPKIKPSISPQDYSNYRYHNHISNDFSASDRFDLTNPIEVAVEIHQVYLNEDGYVELFYTNLGEVFEHPPEVPLDAPIARFHRATLQTVQGFNRLKIKDSEFKKGVTAILSGWPALPIQQPYSEMLIDEITFTNPNGKAVGQTYVFHAQSEKMVKYKDKDKPRKENGELLQESESEVSPPDSQESGG